ncbi:hypothetical protein FRC19_010704 [Serendipita sp. 401]|nr:hypothetical protein FRC15_004538 [Serendipita sp. 397]KAG8818370.1 hypothetical protein FRC19_010704 [Serendipita sp. 401]KAG9051890.1 hypothetical protein FS842_010864 [Serendipita sp. 407]
MQEAAIRNWSNMLDDSHPIPREVSGNDGPLDQGLFQIMIAIAIRGLRWSSSIVSLSLSLSATNLVAQTGASKYPGSSSLLTQPNERVFPTPIMKPSPTNKIHNIHEKY